MGAMHLPIESMTFAQWWRQRAPQVLRYAEARLQDEQAASMVLGCVCKGLSHVSAKFSAEPACSTREARNHPKKWFRSLDGRWLPGGPYFWTAVKRCTVDEGRRISNRRRRWAQVDAAANELARVRSTINPKEAAELHETIGIVQDCLDKYLDTLSEPDRTFCNELCKQGMEQVAIVDMHNEPTDPYYMQYNNALLTTGILKGRARVYRTAIRTCVEKKLAR
jgi:hypothetical protein